MLVYADREVRPVLASAPPLDLERIVVAGFALQPSTGGQDHWPSATVHRPW